MGEQAILEDGTVLKKLAGGFQFVEGPVWIEEDRSLYFSDIPASITRRWTDRGGIEIARQPNDKSNGMCRDLDGQLLVCQHATRRVVKWHPGGKSEVITSTFDGARYNSPNDVVVRSDGCIYFTDPPYGLSAEFGEPGEQQLAFQGVFRTDPTRQQVVLMTDRFYRPNGLAFAPGEKRLYVNDSEVGEIRVFDVNAAGDLSNEQLFADVRGDAPGVPDGMKLDAEGKVFVTGPGGVWVFDADGRKRGEIAVPEVVGNLAFGGDDYRTLFLAASTGLYAIRTNVPGARLGA